MHVVMSRNYQIVLVGLLFALVVAFVGVNAYEKLYLLRSEPGWRAEQQNGHLIIEAVRAQIPAMPLLPGDEVLAINGEPVHNFYEIGKHFRGVPEGHSYTLQIRRAGQEQALNLQTSEISFLARTVQLTQRLLIPALFLLTGLAVFLLKPGDKQATLLVVLFFTISTMFGQAYFSYYPVWLNALLALAALTSDLVGPVMLHFFLIFPEDRSRFSPVLRRFPRIEPWLYLPILLLVTPASALYFFLLLRSPVQAEAFLTTVRLSRISMVLITAYIICGLLSLLLNYRQAGETSQRKMRVVVAGSLIGLLPMMLLFTVSLFAWRLPFSPSFWKWFATLATFAFPLFPLAFAYAIIRHRIIPISFILRRSIRYVFVSQGSLVLEIIAVALGVNLLLWGILKYVATLNVWVIGILSAIDAILVWNITSELHRRVIAPAIDRHFFRQTYNAQQVLAELGHSLRTMMDLRRMTAFAAEKIQAALHTENVIVFLRDEESSDFICTGAAWQREDRAHRERYQSAPVTLSDDSLRLPGEAYTVSRFRESSQPLLLDLDDPNSWVHALIARSASRDPIRQRERETLRRMRPALMIPISIRDQLLGVISLGPRLGDMPFSREDRQLLTTVAMQMALAIENSRLVQQKAEEERLRHELALAAEVQQRLFPKCAPETPSLDLCGVCRPARGVAGDYYDFIQLDPGRIGIAVADVAGKGMAAALLMSAVQASLRSQAQFASGDPTELVATMNRLLFSSTDSSSYATFFYGQFDELTRRMCYVNAGHNPPILYRVGRQAAVRAADRVRLAEGDHRTTTTELDVAAQELMNLVTGGPVIGLLEQCYYECDTVPLETGDVLVAYTDGVTEAFNPQGEEFGEVRLQELIVRNAHLSATEISAAIMTSLAEWSRGSLPHDDQTLVVMKVEQMQIRA